MLIAQPRHVTEQAPGFCDETTELGASAGHPQTTHQVSRKSFVGSKKQTHERNGAADVLAAPPLVCVELEA